MAADLILSSVQESMSSASHIPSDIKFIFRAQEDDMKNIQEIRAHKFILALVSDVFQKEFYGGLKEDGSVEIKDVSKESFEAMINFIYNMKTDLINYNFEILCSLYYLGDKYNIIALKKEALLTISNKSIPASEVLGVGVLADLYSVHEELAETLQAAASRSLANEFEGDLKKTTDFFKQIDLVANPISTNGLVHIMGRLTNVKQPVCENCKTSPCLSGVGITRQNFVPGAKVSHVRGVGADADADKLHGLDGCAEGQFRCVMKHGYVCTLTLSPCYYVYNCKDD